MRTRDKILILLLTLTLALGAFVYSKSRHDDASLLQFRAFVLNHPMRNISNAVTRVAEKASDSDNTPIVWYGGLSVLALVMVGLVFTSAANSELSAFKNRLVDAQVAKAELESLLQDSLWKEKHARAVRETALEELQTSATRILTLEDRLIANERLLKRQEAELKTLRSRDAVAAEPTAQLSSAGMPEQAVLREELSKMAGLLQEKELAAKQLEKSLTDQIKLIETQIESKDKAMAQRGEELATLRAQLAKTETAKREAEVSLQQELANANRAIQAKTAAMQELEADLSGKIATLETRLGDHLKLLQSRGSELETARSEANILAAQLSESSSGKEQATYLLQQELRKKAELLDSKDAALKELQTGLDATISRLERQMKQKDELLQSRNAELDAATAQLEQLASTRQQIDALRGELIATTEALQAKDLTLRELENGSTQLTASLKKKISEQEHLLKRRDEELEVLRSTLYARDAEPEIIHSAGARGEAVDQSMDNEGASNTLEERSRRFAALETSMHDKDDLLKIRDQKIARLEAELKEKRSELAKHEISVWQAYERRAAWKQRLAKFGISIKD